MFHKFMNPCDTDILSADIIFGLMGNICISEF